MLDELLIVLVIAAILLILLAWIFWRLHTTRRNYLIMRGLVESDSSPLLVYDDRDRLIYRTPGLVLFEHNTLDQLEIPRENIPRGQEYRSEVVIDGNRYRCQTRWLEYQPGKRATVIRLNYVERQTGTS